jgi:shikimate kinase
MEAGEIVTQQKGKAVVHGAATIVNAMATGEGAAFGVNLLTEAEVQLTSDPQIIRAKIASDPDESCLLIEKTVSQVLQYFGVQGKFGAKVQTKSNIPIARGLKSSSAAANAVALATVSALGKSLDDLGVVNLGVDAAFGAKVTVTGAFDDACASYFGGVVITNNQKRTVIKQFELPKGLSVLFLVPPKKAYSANSDIIKLKTIAPMVKIAHKEALAGNFWAALSLNGLLYSAAIGVDASPAIDALAAGAISAGLCGKGPAITAVAPIDRIDDVKTALRRFDGDILPAELSSEKAKVVM